MLANRRTLCDSGRDRKEMISVNDNQRQDVDRNAARHEDLREFQAILVEAVDYHREEHEQRERGRDDDVAYDREGAGNADYVRDQDKHEQRVVSGKNFIPSAPALERIIVATNS
jgi:microcompartment protein CcmK/EutM